MILRLLTILFWGTALGLVHTFFLYPISLKFWTLFQEGVQSNEGTSLPSVALIIAAYNEEDVIAEKIENSLQLDYPSELLNIIVFSDESDDRTDEIVAGYQEQGVTLIRIEGRVGKTECQNRVANEVDADLLVFSDANSIYEPDAIAELVQGFSSNVGCVVGELRYQDSSAVEGESFYWKYESWIKRLESRIHSPVSGNGSIYAVRSESYVPQSPAAISDFTEPLSIIRNGEFVKYAPDAVAWEETSDSTRTELQRRIRIVTRSWNSIADFPELLNPFRDIKFAYQLWSHKILRWLSPILLVIVFIANIGLAARDDSVMYQLLLSGQFLFYLFAAFGWLADRFDIESPLTIHVPYYFLQANYGMLLGLMNFLRGKNIVVWETVDRTQE
ncbi:glycosyltransferase family 2 protein [Natronosalvus halobius]|uniref:glycosyltransferase family 2 protein n=1 Tax=Natronosalvus halobius TaxID=2953746 RepID=UPI00209D15BA|nr:glycosyltransferase family 2 protein [Natronosalvus halobius]USZ71480.1 glycosyltransferase family 2 protein [Natronosalvus halobius]